MLAVILVIVVGTIRLIGSNANKRILFGRQFGAVKQDRLDTQLQRPA
jgi:hypothetical protein